MTQEAKIIQMPNARPALVPAAPLQTVEPGKKKRKRTGLIAFVILLAFLIASVVFLYFSIVNDFGGVRTQLVKVLSRLDDGYVDTTPIYRKNLSELQLEDMKTIGTIYTKMPPEDAAGIISKFTEIEDMAAVIYFMPATAAAAVLGAMDSGLAVQITVALIGN